MEEKDHTKDQHFVPRFYLKNFADEKGYLEVLKPREKRMGKHRPYQGVGYEYYFYALITGVPDELSQEIEKWFHPMEDLISRELPRIIKELEGSGQIQDEDIYILSVLMSMLWLRSPGMRSQIEKMNQDLVNEVEKLVGTEQAEQLKTRDNMDHLRFIVESTGFGTPGFASAFYSMKWKVYVSKGAASFVTSDSPIVEKWLPNKDFFYGTGFTHRTKYFALTPKILLELSAPEGSKKLKRKTFYEDEEDNIKSLNIIILTGCHEAVFSKRKEELETLLTGLKSPGPLERAYLRMFELPWAIWRRKHNR